MCTLRLRHQKSTIKSTQRLGSFRPNAITFVLFLSSSVTSALSFPSFTGERGLFPSALPIFSNSRASDVRGGTITSSSPPSSHDGDGERLTADAGVCALALDLPLRGGSKRRRGVQSSDGEKSGCSGWSFEREFLATPKCGFWKARRLPRLKRGKKTVWIRAIETKGNNIQDIVNRFFVWHRCTRANRRTW